MTNNSKFMQLIKNPARIITSINARVNFRLIPDKLYLKMLYKARMGYKLDLNSPKTFNEKLQWLKLYDRNPLYTQLVDKYEVREYIADKIGSEYLIPLIGVYDTFNDINFEELPEKFVLKCTHDSGGVIICKNKSKFDVEAARKKINKLLKVNYYNFKREWPYKNVKPKIICEVYMEDKVEKELKDYKFFCFNGDPKVFFIASDRGTDTKFDFFDLNFERLSLKNHYKNSDKNISKPENFNEMIELSKKLSENIPQVRVDFYEVDGKVYFGELTFFHFSGLEKFEPESYDELFGEWISLPEKH